MSENKRRYTDHLKQTSEHDLLIQLHSKFNSMCAMQKDLKDDLKEFKGKIDRRCETRADGCSKSFESKMPLKTFWQIFAVCVLVFGYFFITITDNSKVISRNSTILEDVKKKLPKDTLEQ